MVRCSIVTAVIAVASATQPQIGTPDTQAQMMKLQDAMMKAQAAANRPGDEALTCDALQQQLVSAVNDPAVQGYVAKAGLAAQQKKDAIDQKAAEYSAPSKGRVAAQTALALASGLIPGAGLPGLMAQAGQAQAQQAAAQPQAV